jgi:hypothetical protein
MMNAKEFWISKYPDAEKDWGNTGHDDLFQVRMMEEYAEYRVKKCDLADVVECAGNKRTPHEKRSEVLSNPLWEYKAGLYKHFKWGWKTLDEAYQIVTS